MATGFKVKQQGADKIWINQTALTNSNWGTTTLRGVVFGNGRYVVVGNGGKVATSPDGFNWTVRPQLATTAWGAKNPSGIVFGNGKFVIASDDGSPAAAVSEDGINWRAAAINGWVGGNGIQSLVFGNNQFILFGSHNVKAAWSPTGEPNSWTCTAGESTLGALNAGNLNAPEWNGSKFLIAGGAGAIWTSNTGNISTWTIDKYNLSKINEYWLNYDTTKVEYANNTFVVVGGGARWATSTDGVTWSYKAPIANSVPDYYGFPKTHTDLYWTGNTWITTGDTFCLLSPDSSSVTVRSTNPGNGNWTNNVLVFGNNRYVFTGGGRTCSTTDFSTWTAFNAAGATGINAYDGIYAYSKHILVGASGVLAYSTDGALTWTTTTVTDFGSQSMYAINYNGSQLIAGGTGGRIATSTDGITWTYRPSLSNTAWSTTAVTGITWTGSQYVACGQSGKLATSSDGITWVNNTSLSSTADWGSNNISSIAYGNGKYVVGGTVGKIAYSSDLSTWTVLTTTFNNLDIAFGVYTCRDVVWNSANSQWLVVGDSGRAATSPDGSTWTYQKGFTDVFGPNAAYAANWNGSQYTVIGVSGKAATSSNGVTWTLQTGLSNTAWSTTTGSGLANSGTSIVAFGSTGQIANSADSITWTYQSGLINTAWTASSAVNASVFNGSQYLIVGANANIARSYDGINWFFDSNLKTTAWGESDSVNTVVWNGSKYVIGGANGKIATSPDGITWTYQGGLASTTWATKNVTEIIWSETKFVAVGDSGAVATSTDGITWTYATNIVNTANLRSIAYKNGTYVASHNGFTTVYTSNDAVTWTLRNITYSGTWINRVRWCKDRFYIVGRNGYASYSFDGITWVTLPSLQSSWTASYHIYDANYDGQRYILIGDSRYAYSDDGVTWTVSSFTTGNFTTLVLDDFDYLVGGASAAIQTGRNNYQVDLDDLLVRRDVFSAGNIYTWGGNNYGQLGDGTTTSKSSPGTVSGNANNWKQVACGAFTVKAIKADGTLWGWGYNVYGDLGDGTSTQRLSPVTVAGGGSNWKQVASSDKTTAALKTDGTLWTFGNNDNGTVGDGTVSGRSSPVTTAGGGSNWKTLSANGTYGNHLAAIKTDGSLWTWGLNGNGQLGDGTAIDKSSPVSVAGGGTWSSVSVGWRSSAAIKTDGTLWTWGYNIRGQLGDNSTTSKSSPVSVSGGGNNWKQVACGYNHMAAVKTDGTLWAWGGASSGQLGTNDSADKSSPVTTVAGGTNWKQVSCGVYFTVAVKTDGTVWAFGAGGNGRLGDNTSVAKSSPVQIAGAGTNWKQVSCGYTFAAGVQDNTL